METCISRFKEGVAFDNSNIVDYSGRDKPGRIRIGKVVGIEFLGRKKEEILLTYVHKNGNDYRWTVYSKGVYAKIIK